MAQTINLGKPINPISDLENIGLGKRIFLVGNGPSLNDMNLDLLENEYSIAMNRIELIYPKTTWRPTWYMFCSSNCEGSQWGDKWSRSILNASNEEKTTPLIWSRYKNAIEKNGGGRLPEKTIYLNYDSKVLPCCQFNGSTTDPAFKEEMIPFIYDGNDKDWNNLYKNSLEDVLTNSWWTRLYSSLTDTPCSVCVSACEKR